MPKTLVKVQKNNKADRGLALTCNYVLQMISKSKGLIFYQNAVPNAFAK